ncbi:C39 family peptidase [Streptobacillus moniliformis]|uniref:C39 family peptidase n=1 Tax=Streptobacillus moniliformis TaxID=34105 RepID=UPI0007E3ACAC|nr:C39 family peptidase [Streptobacillus moniliformis]
MIKKIENYGKVNVKKATGLAPVISYEPWVLRSIESVKQSIIDGNPVLIRLHSAASYPCKNKEDNYKLDLESHAVLIVGFNDDENNFDIVDPWNNFEGNRKGIYKLSYEEYPLLCVNCSLSKDTIITRVLLDVEKIIVGSHSNIKLKLGLYTPKGYIIDQNNTYINNIKIEINYTLNGKEKYFETEIEGNYKIGEYAYKTVSLGEDINEKIKFDIKSIVTIHGTRPYKYNDTIVTEYTFIDKFENKNKEKMPLEITKLEKIM